MKKGILMVLSVLMVFFAVSGSQAALVEFTDLPGPISPYSPGEIEFGVRLTDMGSLPNIDLFNVGLMISGASGLEMPADDVEGPSSGEYIFYENSFSFSAGNPGGDMSRLVFGDITDNAVGVNAADGAFLGWVTLSFPGLEPGTELTLSLLPGVSYIESDFDSGFISEYLSGGPATIYVTPIPAAIWIFGGGILALLRIRRWRPGC